MTLKADLLRAGYLPENLPPSFNTEAVAAYFALTPGAPYFSDTGQAARPAIYSASKRGMSRRVFSAIHPAIAHDLAEFAHAHQGQLKEFFGKTNFSMSIPEHTPDGDRAVSISSHAELEAERLTRLSGYRFIAKTDISRFYHSIYTHSVPWAFHGKAVAKRDRGKASEAVYFNRLDHTLRQGQDGQTIGIPVGPDASRFVAEVVATAVDLEFKRRCDVDDYAAIRHVDDLWIGAHTHADAERALWRYREALREFELDINENKTQIYAENFRFCDAWPSDISSRLEAATTSHGSRKAERLRAALEYAFSLTASGGDDGILKYAIRHLDRSDLHWDTWTIQQPFLMRSAIHYGHTVDFVARVLVWRELTHGDLDRTKWTSILHGILDRQGRLGNDSETSWGIYTCLKLGIEIPEPIASNIVRNCGALTVLALLNCVTAGLLGPAIFTEAFDLISQETASGALWPLFLEWSSREWPRHAEVRALGRDDLIEQMATAKVTIFEGARLPRVFSGVDEADFATIGRAIEARVSYYDDEDEDEDEDAGDLF